MRRILGRLVGKRGAAGNRGSSPITTPSPISSLSFFAHALFALGAILLFVYSNESAKPIRIEQATLYKIILIYATGYLVVFTKWLGAIKSKETYLGNADEVPKYLTKKLWGDFPYLGTLGRSNSGNQRGIKITPHLYQEQDVGGKRLGEIFLLHVDEHAIFLLVISIIFIPYMFINQYASSFLNFIFKSSLMFTIYLSLLIFVWLSSIAVLMLRTVLWFKFSLKK